MPYGSGNGRRRNNSIRNRSDQSMRVTCTKCGGPNTGAHKTYCKQCYSNYQRLYKASKTRRYRDVVVVDDNTEWQTQAACKGKCSVMFQNSEAAQKSVAEYLCNGQCTVKDQCLEFALTNNIGYGVWGGMTETERFNISTRRGRKLGPLSDRLSESQLSTSFT